MSKPLIDSSIYSITSTLENGIIAMINTRRFSLKETYEVLIHQTKSRKPLIDHGIYYAFGVFSVDGLTK